MIRSILAGGVAGIAGAVVVLLVQGQPFELKPVGMTYAELAATGLAAAAILTTVIGIFIAVLAIWGFSTFRDMAKATAKDHVNEQIKEGELKPHIEGAVTEFLKAEFSGGNLRRLMEERLDAILVSAPSERAREERASENDVPINDL